MQTAWRRWRPACALAVALCFAAVASSASSHATVIVLSWDGVRYDYLDREGLPALSRVEREGARAERLIPPFPSSTFPSHVSLATGAPSDRHGIVANRFYDPARAARGEPAEFDYGDDASWIDAEPIWVTAERQGLRSAVFFWVGSETDWRGRGASLRKAPFDARVPESAKVDQILEWLDLPEAERPRLIMAYWHGADRAGHRDGPASDEVDVALRGQDAQLARLLSGLDERGAWPTTTLLIASDHGMAQVDQPIDAQAIVRKAGVDARVLNSSGFANVYLRDPADAGAAQRAASALSAHPAVTAWQTTALPEHLRYAHPSRVGQVVALTKPPFVFRGSLRGLTRRVLGNAKGAHGYDPSTIPEMAGILVALGRNVGRGVVLPAVRAIDLAPTVAALLGIEPPAQSEGRTIELAPALGEEE